MKERIGRVHIDWVRCLYTGPFTPITVACFLFVLLLVPFFTLHAQGRQEGVGPGNLYFPVHDFQNEFVVYDEAFKAYVPFIAEQHASERAVSSFVDLESNRRYKLLVQSKADGFLFINAALRRKCPAGQWLVLDIDSLHRLYRKPQVFITLYGPPVVGNWQFLIGHARAQSQQTIRLNDDLLSVRPRSLTGFDDFFSVGLLFLLASHAFLYTLFRRGFLTYYNPVNLLRLDPPDESFLINRPLGGVSMAFTLNLSLGLAFLFLYVQSQHVSLFGVGTFLLQGQTFGQLLVNYLAVTAIVFVLMLGKYFLIVTVGGLYKFDSIVSLHYFRILEASLVFTTLLLLVTAAISPYSNTLDSSSGLFIVPFIAYYVGRLAWLYLTLVRQMAVKNLYLFSYLCIVELIPLVIGIRFAVR